jgi:phospholipase A1
MLLALPAPASEPPATVPASALERCMSIADDADRLGCFEALARGATVPATPRVSRAPEAGIGPVSAAWRIPQDEDTLGIFPYRTSYLLPLTLTDRINEAPYEGLADSPLEPDEFERIETQLQLSFRLRLARKVLAGQGTLWFGYTQRSFWQAYNGEASRPFRETNYQPELILSFDTDYDLFALRGRVLGVAFNHHSNGRGEVLSRSWNRIIGFAGLETDRLALLLRAWYRIPESDDDNPEIEEFMGQGDIFVGWRFGEQDASVTINSNFDASDLRGGIEIAWGFPIPGTEVVRGHVNYYYGYGESLIDHDFKAHRVGIGVSMTDWLAR